MLRETKAFSGFSVDDIVAAKKFYGDVLGLNVDEDEMGLTLKLAGGNQVFVYAKDDHIPATFTILNFQVDNIDRAIDELMGRDVQFERYNNLPVAQDDKGVLRGLTAQMGPDIAWFKDPASNILSLVQEV